MRVNDIPGIEQLSLSEKILLVEELWDSIATDAGDIPVPESHALELDRRLKRYEQDPGRLLSLDELKHRLAARK